MEHTLEDAIETLKEISLERRREKEDLAAEIRNNEAVSLNEASTDIKEKKRNLCHTLSKLIEQEKPKDYALPNSCDLHVEVLQEMEEEIQNWETYATEQLQKHLDDIQEDIRYLQNKKNGLEKMQEAALSASESVRNKTYEKEVRATKRIFHEVKSDLRTVVNILFPDNIGFADLLSELTAAYTKGGDNVYVDVKPEAIPYLSCLLEADIIAFHRYDKTKIRLTEML